MVSDTFDKFGVRLNPPASTEDIAAMDNALGVSIPFMTQGYQDHDGYSQNDDFRPRFRLMPTREVIDFHHVGTIPMGWADQGFRVFYTDDNSNYAGLFVNRPIAGRVSIIEHDEPNFAPRFRNHFQFEMALLYSVESDVDWDDIKYNYPAPASISQEDAESDLRAVEGLRPLFDNAIDDFWRAQYAYSIMALLPADRAAMLLDFTYDDDFYISEYACNALGQRRYAPAVNRLRELLELSIPNVPSAARRALRLIETQ